MARFTFVKGRKKSPPQLLIAEPLSKAHKILGSTPISIDSSKPWDDASSGFSGGTATSYTSTEDDSSDVHVAIAPSEDEWTSDSDMLPAIFESSGLESDSDRGTNKMTRGLRETQSSSTIRLRYDIPPPAPVMSKGVPSKIHKMLDLENYSNDPKLKKKPPMLDFSNLRNASRLSRKASHSQQRTDETVANDVGSFNRSPSTSLTPNGKSQKIHKRDTKDEMPSPAVGESQHTHMMGGKHRGNLMKEAPSLYYHYEQMTLRQLRKKAETLEGEQQRNEEAMEEASTEDDEETEAGQNLPWLHDILPPTPQTAFMTGLTPAAFRDRSNSTASEVTASTKPSKTIARPDLQETSMLMLSSDSEEDDGPVLVLHSQTNQKCHLPTTVATRTTSNTQPSRAPSQASDYRPTHRSKKASFASANTYITFPNTRRLSTDTSVSRRSGSKSSTLFNDATSLRTSLMSNVSNMSTLRSSANYIQEARAVTMLAGRGPSRVECDLESSPDAATPLTNLPAAKKLPTPANTPPEELTPPLSPTSVDFFLRSARSSVDDSGSHNRYMAVTRQEEMLLSAWRNKQQHDKERPSEAPQQPAEGCNTLGLTRASTAEEVEVDETDSVSSAEISAVEAMIEFGFPAPPSTRKKPFFQNALAASASQSRRASTATTDQLSHSSTADTDSIVDSIQPSLTPALTAETPLKGMMKSSHRREESEQQEMTLYLDDTKSNPDITDFSEFGYLTMPSLQSGRDKTSLHLSSSVSETMRIQSSSSHTMATSKTKQLDCVRSSPSAMVSVPEDGEPKYEYEDTPRPDSPVSPDIFPTVPQLRTTPTNLARLSAVGSSPMMNELGWWGDDD
ncbi:hypothetical protein BBO_00208 [Beauveria brongniartii RCEF 3172]|uniref:Uncharacterized protein n=1 Tax=Beauveria brongniartii RCEF 3172 TaxID=1081107 RepID=A0A167KY99_9HYPO|nr:hypothetical protein BBO_00208 [Beauveria brongniartii RCEF 3172]